VGNFVCNERSFAKGLVKKYGDGEDGRGGRREITERGVKIISQLPNYVYEFQSHTLGANNM